MPNTAAACSLPSIAGQPGLVKRDLYAYRRETIELLFQRLIQACDLKACPTKGLARTGTFVIASVWLYQGLFLDNYRHNRPRAHIKEIIDEARWRIEVCRARETHLPE